jgi:uncharacterized membrane protein YjjP (DUF1212 family)
VALRMIVRARLRARPLHGARCYERAVQRSQRSAVPPAKGSERGARAGVPADPPSHPRGPSAEPSVPSAASSAPTSAPTSAPSSAPGSERARLRTAEEIADYVAEVGALAARYGSPAYRIENLVRVVAAVERHDAEAFALPTGLFLTVQPRGRRLAPVHRMVRLVDWTIDLDRLLLVDGIFNDVAAGRASIDEGRAALHDLEARPPVYPRLARWLAAALTTGGVAVLLRGRLVDVGAAVLVGLALYAMGRLLGRHRDARFLHDFAGAVVASLLAGAVTLALPRASRDVVLLAGMITLYPGMTLTTGLAELTQKNLVAGGARLMEALVTFLSLAFGIALSVALYRLTSIEIPAAHAREALPWPAQVAGVVALSTGLGVGFHMPRRLLWAALFSGGLAWLAMLLGGRVLPTHIASFAAATLVCSAANLLARHTGRPAQLYHLPGMMLLVPGSLGFLSFDDFVRGTYLAGAEKLVAMSLVAGGLVMGVLLANVLVPPKKLL